MAQAQLSIHGHRDAVKYFTAVPGQGGASVASSSAIQPELSSSINEESRCNSSMLILSGGEGYVDFRKGNLT